MTMTTRQSATVTLPADDQILITREFDAPPRLVWRAITEPELVRRWFHANRAEVAGCDIDLRVGGTWRYVSRLPDGTEFAFSGEYREIVPGERIVTTECFEPIPGACSVNTMTLTDLGDGRTRLETLVQHDSRQARDGQIDSGMEAGMQDAFDLLEDVARSLGDTAG